MIQTGQVHSGIPSKVLTIDILRRKFSTASSDFETPASLDWPENIIFLNSKAREKARFDLPLFPCVNTMPGSSSRKRYHAVEAAIVVNSFSNERPTPIYPSLICYSILSPTSLLFLQLATYAI